MSDKRVVVTGMGAVTPLGNDVKTFWENAVNGVSGAARITRFNPEKFKTQFACEVKDFDPKLRLERNEIKRTDLYTQFGIDAAAQAIDDAGFEFDKMDPFDVGVIWGTGQGGLETLEKEVQNYTTNGFEPRFNPFLIPKMLGNMAGGMIALKYGYMGINFSTVSACATSNTSIMDAMNYIKLGKAKIIVTGGSEAPVTEASIGGFSAMKALSTRNDNPESASRPYDPDRDGFVMGEGGGALVLEDYEHAKARGAHIYAELVGSSMTNDAYHMTATHPEGLGAYQAMKLALNEGHINPSEVDYINTHSTSTPVGDISEPQAIRRLMEGQTNNASISGTKSMTGHLLGAAGVVEAILSINSIIHNIIPPTINTESIDPVIGDDLDIVIKEAREKEVKIAMSNTFGFGGHNGIALFRELK
ncbi:3-oxoacyl-[acyl-carrier-protein] synthase II [Reichenbachiella agariperforans]|uniref:3-oxoacyl-[acyl-carrier-protein] synthase 2 n=1 Tax=Reichenbachiella agariperforans TaxID=156994 RepID=A0A1M6L724_REIAG|nr:beta-ketoacyl-ACP synthase II [Reichenbachiella agariperforans]SHJ67048.1 3-oxoacyl-[acyl-carrier-protein] synthase II [Reichenbachiella agariperforans]